MGRLESENDQVEPIGRLNLHGDQLNRDLGGGGYCDLENLNPMLLTT